MKGILSIILAIIVLALGIVGVIFLPGSPVTGMFILEVSPQSFSYDLSRTITSQQALDAILLAEEGIAQKEELGIDTQFATDALFSSRASYDQGNYSLSFAEASLALHLIDAATIFLESQEETEKLLEQYASQGADTSEAQDLLTEAKTSFDEGRFDEAILILDDADAKAHDLMLSLQKEQGVRDISRGFFEQYWTQIMAIGVILAILSLPTSAILRKNLMKAKLKRFKKEYERTKILLKTLQEDCFVKGNVSNDSYKIKSEQHHERLEELKRQIPVLEAELSGRKRTGGVPKGVLQVKENDEEHSDSKHH